MPLASLRERPAVACSRDGQHPVLRKAFVERKVYPALDSLTPDHRAVFVSPGPNLQDGRWHMVALSLHRNSHTGGRLYVDGRQVLTFDPTGQSGDFSNAEPLRVGNHANSGLKCFFYGFIDRAALYRHALGTEEISASYRQGRSGR